MRGELHPAFSLSFPSRPWPGLHRLPEGCHHDASLPAVGHLVLHDAHLPGPGQPGRRLEEVGEPRLGGQGGQMLLYGVALRSSCHLLALIISTLPTVPTLLSCQAHPPLPRWSPQSLPNAALVPPGLPKHSFLYLELPIQVFKFLKHCYTLSFW